jgi:hypothetical protein
MRETGWAAWGGRGLAIGNRWSPAAVVVVGGSGAYGSGWSGGLGFNLPYA